MYWSGGMTDGRWAKTKSTVCEIKKKDKKPKKKKKINQGVYWKGNLVAQPYVLIGRVA